MSRPVRIGLIGYGAIGRALEQCLRTTPPVAEIVAVLTRTRQADLGGRSVASLEALLETRPDIVVECAGQDALRQHAPPLLREGRDVVVASVGALADAASSDLLARAAADGGGRILVASGAVAGLDGLAAAKHIGITAVVYRQRAPVTSWLGHRLAPANLPELTEHVMFRGTAREAAQLFPKNANVTASVALAGIGLDRTQVELVSDATIGRNRHEIFAEGAFGVLSVEISAEPISPGIRSSRIVAGSLLHAAVRGAQLVQI